MAYRLFHADMADKAIADGKIDYWENCRPQIADPLMPLKYLEGREEDIRWCVACNVCLARLFRDAPMTCYINPLCAHEHDPEYYPQPAEDQEDGLDRRGRPRRSGVCVGRRRPRPRGPRLREARQAGRHHHRRRQGAVQR